MREKNLRPGVKKMEKIGGEVELVITSRGGVGGSEMIIELVETFRCVHSPLKIGYHKVQFA